MIMHRGIITNNIISSRHGRDYLCLKSTRAEPGTGRPEIRNNNFKKIEHESAYKFFQKIIDQNLEIRKIDVYTGKN